MEERQPRWRRILVGTDLSTQSQLAVDYAVQLAEVLQLRLDIVYVHETVVSAVPEMAIVPADEGSSVADDQRRLDELTAQLGARVPTASHLLSTATVPGLFQQGPAMALLKLVEELRPDFVVVGSHGRGAVMRFLLGSVGEQLVRHSPVPVIVIPDPERAAEAKARAS